jgi:flagellar basal body-associated protein FliL
MLTIICIVIALALLGIGGVFALMAKDSNRRGQSGTAQAESTVKQGRASGLD